MMKADYLFTKLRERQEAELGSLPARKEMQRKELQADIDAFLANGGTITKVTTKPSEVEQRLIKIAKKQKLSEKEINMRLKELAETGKVTL